MNFSQETATNVGLLAKPRVSMDPIPVSSLSTAPERRGQPVRVFLFQKLGKTNFVPASYFHFMKNAPASFTSFSCPAARDVRKTTWHGSCSPQGDVSSFPRWSAGQEIPSRGRRSAFTENWTAPMAGRFPHIMNQPTIK